ncbi:hypothetical protein [Vibrio furnissii]|uniref:hypothetical protein n=1 Tax=Vibrio furnissii TaxID=29494 RepID=UPI0012AE2760|nr:hypothetical protein [Vibrio furnissii]
MTPRDHGKQQRADQERDGGTRKHDQGKSADRRAIRKHDQGVKEVYFGKRLNFRQKKASSQEELAN